MFEAKENAKDAEEAIAPKPDFDYHSLSAVPSISSEELDWSRKRSRATSKDYEAGKTKARFCL